MLQVPEYVITHAEKATWDFIWDGKPDKVKRDVCRRHRSAEYLKHIIYPTIDIFSKCVNTWRRKLEAPPTIFF